MVVCQYYLKGTCKFGSQCRNEHGSGPFQNTSFSNLNNNKSSFQLSRGQSGNNWAKFQNNNDSQDSVEKTIQLIRNEMELWKNSKMWPFSCFSHQKEKPCVTGLTDYSPEEVRLEAYKSKDTGNTGQYLNIIQQYQAQWINRINELKNLTAAAWEQEQRKFAPNTANSLFQSTSKGTGLFSSSSTLFSTKQTEKKSPGLFSSISSGQSAFGQSSGQSSSQSMFGKPSTFGMQASNPFGSKSQSTFGTQMVQPLFGQSSSTGAQGSGGLFSQKSSNQSMFGQQSTNQTSGGLFSQSTNQNSGGPFSQPANQNSGGPFSQPANQNSGGLFSQSANQTSGGLFSKPANQTSGGLFSQSTNQNSGGLFTQSTNQKSGGLFSKPANQASGGLFSQQTASVTTNTSQGLFTKQPTQGLFSSGGSATQNNPFGQRQASTTQQSSNSILGNSSQTVNSTQASSASNNPFLQAAMQQTQESGSSVPEVGSTIPVTEKDIAAFKADRFVFGQIPECPPPLELC